MGYFSPPDAQCLLRAAQCLQGRFGRALRSLGVTLTVNQPILFLQSGFGADFGGEKTRDKSTLNTPVAPAIWDPWQRARLRN